MKMWQFDWSTAMLSECWKGQFVCWLSRRSRSSSPGTSRPKISKGHRVERFSASVRIWWITELRSTWSRLRLRGCKPTFCCVLSRAHSAAIPTTKRSRLVTNGFTSFRFAKNQISTLAPRGLPGCGEESIFDSLRTSPLQCVLAELGFRSRGACLFLGIETR